MMEPNIDWIVVFRTAGILEMALILGLLIKQKEHSTALRLMQIFVTCVLSYLISEYYRPPSIIDRPPFTWYALISIAMTIPALYWALVRVIFSDDFQWGKTEWWVIGIYQSTSVISLVFGHIWKFELDRGHLGIMALPVIMQIGLSIWALYTIVDSWKIDLLESRRRLRLVAVTIIGSYTILALIFELSGINSAREESALLIHTAAIAVFGFVALLLFGKLNVSTLYLPSVDIPGTPLIDNVEDIDVLQSIDTELEIIENWEKHLFRIRDQRLYALDNMTIAKLADLLSVPEYRLRKQIVQTTPFKNFNQFLNNFRIEEAASRLRNEEERKLPILTIALDVGFRSLPSFNRSFKVQYQMTPSEYRKSELS